MSAKAIASVDNNDPESRAAEREFYSPRQLAARYDVTIPTIWRWRRTGILPDCVRIGGQSRWTADAIRAFEATRPHVADNPFLSVTEKKAQKHASDDAAEASR